MSDTAPARVLKHPERVACSQCAGVGQVKQWIEGKPHTAHMGRCEQCSGFGKVLK